MRKNYQNLFSWQIQKRKKLNTQKDDSDHFVIAVDWHTLSHSHRHDAFERISANLYAN